MVCIEIEVADDGSVTVGVCPPEEETGEPKDYMQPVGSVDEALAQAKELLGEGTPADAESVPEDDGEAFEAGYTNVRGKGLNG